jgi:tRNA threonylcarbamoyladenosine biosynthesis protein TsaE
MLIYNFTEDLDNIDKIINKIKELIDNKNIIILLRGDLASGKTTLVKSYVKSLNPNDEVTSPTFCLQNVYSNNIYHYDIYNKTLEEFISLGLLEEFERDGIHFVEWGDDRLKSILNEYGFHILTVNIVKEKNKREYKIEL